MPRIKKITVDEREILDNFFEKLKKVLKEEGGLKTGDLNWETFKFILSQSNFTASEYFKAFEALPDEAKNSILKKVNIENINILKKEFKRALNVYNSAIRVRK